MAGADLCALGKKTGGIRPIAAGDTFRRLVAKCHCKTNKDSLKEHFLPDQVGVAVAGGAEALVHLTRQIWDDNLNNNDFVILKVDMRNAYNRMFRSLMVEWVREEYPDMEEYVWFLYGGSSNLIYGSDIIKSEEGAQQGCGLASMLFSGLLMRKVA